MIDVCLVGTGGTLPLPRRYLASVLLRYNGHLVLIDCGEGTQVSLREIGWGLKEIGTICITHFHADHISGLPGLLLTIGNSGRTETEPVTIIGPRGLQHVVEQLRVIARTLPYPIHYLEVSPKQSLAHPLDQLQLTTCWGEHDSPCLAYRFDLPRAPQFQPERARALGVPVQQWKTLQKGESIVHDGETVTPEAVLGPPRRGLSLGYVTDSRPTRDVTHFFSDVDLLISEASYGDPEDQHKAIANKHMTFREAGEMAQRALAKQLWLTHFSPSLPNPEYFRREVEEPFPNAVIGRDHQQTTLKFGD